MAGETGCFLGKAGILPQLPGMCHSGETVPFRCLPVQERLSRPGPLLHLEEAGLVPFLGFRLVPSPDLARNARPLPAGSPPSGVPEVQPLTPLCCWPGLGSGWSAPQTGWCHLAMADAPVAVLGHYSRQGCRSAASSPRSWLELRQPGGRSRVCLLDQDKLWGQAWGGGPEPQALGGQPSCVPDWHVWG